METAISLPFSAAFLPRTIPRCCLSNGRVSVSSSPLIKFQIWQTRRRRSIFSSGNRVPSFSVKAEDSGSSQSMAAVPNSVSVNEAYELLKGGHHYLDVRTAEEFDAGHVNGAVNIPFTLRPPSAEEEIIRNPKFLVEVLDHFGKEDEIVVGCQIGRRSFVAATELVSAGFTGITNMAGGYADWVQNGLPTTV